MIKSATLRMWVEIQVLVRCNECGAAGGGSVPWADMTPMPATVDYKCRCGHEQTEALTVLGREA